MDDERIRKEKVTGRVLTLDRSLEDTLPYLFSLLDVEDPESSLYQMDAQIRRQRTFEALKKLFLRESLNQPLILIFEDLHWTDTETQGFLDTLSESVASAQLLLLVNYRPEYRHEWGQKTYYTQLRLAPLGKAEAEELLTALLGDTVGATGRSPLHALKQLILEKTDGTPFFMEEVVQTLVEEGTLSGDRGQYHLAGAPTDLQIPPTVQGILAARIDRLASEEKALLQQLSVIGRQFPVSLVKQVVTEPEDVLYRVLSALQAKEFLYEQPAFPESEYLFKHALTQEVAYGTVLQEQRRVLHERTGQALEALYAEKLVDHYSELAHHYSHSGNTQKAVEYLYLAGQQAAQRSAHAEAVTRLTTALELLKTLPDGRERAEQELRLQLALGPALVVNKSYTAPEIEHAYTRALELSRQMEDPARLFPAMKGLCLFSFTKGAEFQRVCELGEQLVRLADEAHSPVLQIEAYYALGIGLQYRGELSAGRTYLEQSVDLYDPRQHASLRFLSGEDLGVSSLASTSYALWTLGYPEQARQAMQGTLTLAREVSDAFSVAHALAFAAGRHLHYRDYALAQEYAEAAITLSTEHGIVWWHALADIFCGGALAAQGQPTEGIAQIRQGLEVYQTIGAELWRPY